MWSSGTSPITMTKARLFHTWRRTPRRHQPQTPRNQKPGQPSRILRWISSRSDLACRDTSLRLKCGVWQKWLGSPTSRWGGCWILERENAKVEIHNIAYTEMCVVLFFLKGEDLVSEPQDEAKEGTEEHRHRLGTRTLRRQQRPPSRRCTPQLFVARPACSFPRLRAFVFHGYSKLCGLVLPTLPVKLWQERQRLGHRTKSSLNGGRFVVLFWP